MLSHLCDCSISDGLLNKFESLLVNVSVVVSQERSLFLKLMHKWIF